jgi:ornithine cyclodeaminase/alanine dehydrogenase-like protein (mu-crystallin family)
MHHADPTIQKAGGIIVSQLLYLSRADVEALGITMAEVISDVEEVLAAKSRGDVEMPPKPGIHPRPDSFIHAMPCFVRFADAAGIKWVAGYPANREKGLPYITGLYIFNDADTGLPLAVMDATWMTAVRTAAATAVAAKYLARPDARALAILGCGVQGHSNLEALCCVLNGLREFYAYDVRKEAARELACRGNEEFDLAAAVCDTPELAVSKADVVVTAGPILRNPSPVIETEWLKPGAFVCTLDFDSYVTPNAFRAADILCSDDVQQLNYYRSQGYFRNLPDAVTDLGEVITGKIPGRRSEEERIISVHLGLAAEDAVTAKRIYASALEQQIGTMLEL